MEKSEKSEKKKMILAIAGILAAVLLAVAILLHGFGIGRHVMRGAAPYAYSHEAYRHGGWGYHH